MARLVDIRGELVDTLLGHHGPQPPPGGGEGQGQEGSWFGAIAAVAVGLIADPPTARAVLEALRAANLLDAEALGNAASVELEDVLRQGRIKLAAKSLRPLQKLAAWVAGSVLEDDTDEWPSTESLREGWRAINGIGPAMADALLLFALGRASYPVDRGTYRVLVRHGWLDPTADYDEARSVAEGLAPDDPATLARIAPALGRLAKDYCKAAVPRCDRCPLRPWLPEDGPRGTE